MTFTVYIRIMLLFAPVLMITCMSEIYENDNSDPRPRFSLAIAYFIFFAIHAFVALFIVHYFLHSQKPSDMFKEFYAGLKQGKAERSYDLASLLRKYLIIVILVFGVGMSVVAKVTLIYLIQMIFTIFLCLLRPHKHVIDTIIHIIVEVTL